MSNFLFLRMSYHKCYCRWAIKHTWPSFGQQNISKFPDCLRIQLAMAWLNFDHPNQTVTNGLKA